MTTSTSKPAKTTLVTAPVGLLNLYEFTMSYSGSTIENGYLNNDYFFFFLTPASSTNIYTFTNSEVSLHDVTFSTTFGVRPVINIKGDLQIASGSGTASDPYTLSGN